MTKRAYYLGILFVCSFIGMCVYLASAYSTGIHEIVAISIFGVIALTYLFILRKKAFGNDQATNEEIDNWQSGRILKVIFASFGLSFGCSILLLLAGILLVDFEKLNSYIDKYSELHLIVLALLFFPATYKWLK